MRLSIRPANLLFAFLLTILQLGCVAESIRIDSPVDPPKYAASLSGSLFKPDGAGPLPAVILMHGCSGLTSGVLQGLNDHASYLVDKGFVALVLDSFSPRGKYDQDVCSSEAELGAARYYRQYDAYHALKHLRTLSFVDGKNVFLVGQSNGGSVALYAAAGPDKEAFSSDLRFRAIVAYYPWCGALPTRIVSPLLVFGAGRDDWVSPVQCVLRRPYVTGAPYEVVLYKSAHHSFDLPIPVQSYSGHTVGGDSEAREDSRRKMVEWFLRFKA